MSPRHTPGNYVPLDVNYPHDRAIREAGTNAELLFIRALAYAKRTRSGGFVPDYDLQVVAVGMRSVPAAVASLLRVALWAKVDGGWQIRSWERWNAGTEAVSAGGKLGNHKRWHADRGVIDPECDLCGDRPPIAPDVAPDSVASPQGESQGKGREGKERTTTSAAADEPDRFAEFYATYPRKEARRKAEQAWRAATKRADADTIMAGLARFPFRDDPQFVPLPASWLNADRWADQPQLSIVTPPAGEAWTEAQLTAVLGPDRWRLPQPPSDLSPDERWEWTNNQRAAHRAERVRQAIAKQQRGGVA